nr:hypothetical protein [uncultured Trichococcus sp.]
MIKWIGLFASFLLVGCMNPEAEAQGDASTSVSNSLASEVISSESTKESSVKKDYSTPITTFIDMDTLDMLAGTGPELYAQLDDDFDGLLWEDTELTEKEFDEFLGIFTFLSLENPISSVYRDDDTIFVTFENSDEMSGENITYALAMDYILRRLYQDSKFYTEEPLQIIITDSDYNLILGKTE